MHLCRSLLFLLLGCSNLFVQISNVVKGMQGKIGLSFLILNHPILTITH